MCTTLTTGREMVEGELAKLQGKGVRAKLARFHSKKADMFFCIWFASADNPDSENLMGLH
jgi:hypothetical protein